MHKISVAFKVPEQVLLEMVLTDQIAELLVEEKMDVSILDVIAEKMKKWKSSE